MVSVLSVGVMIVVVLPPAGVVREPSEVDGTGSMLP